MLTRRRPLGQREAHRDDVSGLWSGMGSSTTYFCKLYPYYIYLLCPYSLICTHVPPTAERRPRRCAVRVFTTCRPKPMAILNCTSRKTGMNEKKSHPRKTRWNDFFPSNPPLKPQLLLQVCTYIPTTYVCRYIRTKAPFPSASKCQSCGGSTRSPSMIHQ